jgi:hypothetical protein
MSIIAKGFQADLVLYVAFSAVIILYIVMYREKAPSIRSIAALDAIDEVAGRAAEMNRPVHFTTGVLGGWGGMAGRGGKDVMAGVSVLSRVAESCAKLKGPLIVSSPMIEARPLIEETMANAYRAAGAEGDFDPAYQIHMNIPYIYGWAAEMVDTLVGEECAGNILIGSGVGATFFIFETGARIGAIQLTAAPGYGGSTAFAAAVADYVIIGPEIYGIGAMATGEPEQIGSLIGQDLMDVIVIGLFVVGTILVNAGNNVIKDLLNL